MADCTLTAMVQGVVARLAFAKLIEPLPAAAVTVPPHRFTTFGVDATTRFAGRVSVKLESIVTVFPLATVNVTVLIAFGTTMTGLKLFVIDGGCNTVTAAVIAAWSTVTSADPLPPTPPAL